MSNGPSCVYDGCENGAKVVRVVEVSGRELTYCRDHDPLRDDSGVQHAFAER